jgi:hypothetical protein
MVECKVEKSNVFLSSKAGVMIPVEVRVDSSMWLEVKRLKIPNGKQKPSIKTVQKRKGQNDGRQNTKQEKKIEHNELHQEPCGELSCS